MKSMDACVLKWKALRYSTIQERETSFNDMMQVALETAIAVE